MKLKPLLVYTCFILTTLIPSHAEDICPADAEQQLYTMAQKIEAGQQSEIDPVLNLARWAIETCPDRAHAQALAALLMSSVLQTATDTKTFSNYLTLTYRAVAQNDIAWKGSPPSIALTTLDGSNHDFYGYNYASRTYQDSVLKGLVRLWQNEAPHPLVLGAEEIACPFTLAKSSKRLDDELVFWRKVAGAREVRDRHTLIRSRLKTLHKACPAGKLEISWALANSYGNDLIRLTDWKTKNHRNEHVRHRYRRIYCARSAR
ncbi:MAG: hypothetical protein AAGI14_06065 [Pseudomonadota bacterium]